MPETRVENFCTLFDLGYLPQGMALRDSLEKFVGRFVLWVLCMDKDVEEALRKLNLPSVNIIPLREIESPELLQAKQNRSHAEYCWTMSPFLPKFILFNNPSILRVTYIDSDAEFINRPMGIYKEFEESKKHVLYTEHGYSPEYDQSSLSGRYCVQFQIYKNTPECFKVLNWWGDRCLEWCYARKEDGKLGDQRYLEQWEILFPDETHLLTKPEHLLAPWNATRFPYGSATIFHFHGLRFYHDAIFGLWSGYKIPKSVELFIYYRYALQLSRMTTRMIESGIQPRFAKRPTLTFDLLKARVKQTTKICKLATIKRRYETQFAPVEVKT